MNTRWVPQKHSSKPPKPFSLLNTCGIDTGITWLSVFSVLGGTTFDTEQSVLSESRGSGDGSLEGWNISNYEIRDIRSLAE
ncbi:hypothetical protein EMCG_02484 [[Emmonsia] crescens]|uniref:Uncharacterized protein n=1 Tax=[Emmonsia] crescens TaxID=73230 RepID=A0A0G2HXT0_9EURO|nr:hypothetical protein EMCG_02484 [Emmonsia crescens UAMH 3008]